MHFSISFYCYSFVTNKIVENFLELFQALVQSAFSIQSEKITLKNPGRKMKKIFSILIILIFFKQSYALECKACEATDADATCELSYECDKGAKYCETLVSKVEGSYSVVMSCSTEEKCDAKAILKDGLDECDHDE